MDDYTQLHHRLERMLATGDSTGRSIPLATPTKTFSVAEIMLPDHLLLRVPVALGAGNRPRVLVNWPAYKFGIETMLHAYGLEGHIAAEGDPRRTQVSTQQWEAEEELCRAIIGFNVKDFTEIFGDSRLAEKSVGDIWKWLASLRKERTRSGMDSEEDECKIQ